MRKLFLLIVFCLFIFPSCATILKDSNQKVSFDSRPISAKVYIDGQPLGNTPLSLELATDRSYIIEFRKEGYENKSVLLNNSVNSGFVILDVICGLIPVIIDAETGAWYDLDRNYITGWLQKEGEAKK